MGVVYHTNYLVWCEIGRTELIRAMTGESYAKLERAGVALAVADLSIRYHGAATYDNLIRVKTSLTDARSRSVTFEYLISNWDSGERLASARTNRFQPRRLARSAITSSSAGKWRTWISSRAARGPRGWPPRTARAWIFSLAARAA